MHYTAHYDSPLGDLLIATNENALVGVWTENHKYYASTLSQETSEKLELPVIKETITWLDRYFAKENPAISELTLAPQGSKFRQQVWEILCSITYGEVMTYGEIAQLMAEKTQKARMSSQAVGGAVGHNPISVIIPCHRVVGADGSLTGYAGGISKKIKLLELEGVDMSNMYIPKTGTAL